MNAVLIAQMSPMSVAALVFVCVVTWMLLGRASRYYRAQRSVMPVTSSTKRAPAPEPALTHAPRDHERWEVRMHDLARELSAQLDSKTSALIQLVNQAERRIAELEALLEQSTSAGESHVSLDLTSSVGTQAEGLSIPAEVSEPAIERTSGAVTTRQAEIFNLADAGHTSRAIAERVGAPIGEVELMLGLRQHI